jgi:hypothetical protein
MKTLAFIALISITYFVIGLIILHFLRSDINPVKQATAYYAVGAHRFIMTSVFFSVFVASVALLIGFYQGIMASARSNLGLVLLGLWSAGVLVALCFPINPEGVPMTIPARIHRMSTPAIFLCLTLGIIFISRSFRQDSNWYPIYHSASVLSWLMLVTFIATFVVAITKTGFLGLAQRASLAIFAIWVIVVAARMLVVAGGEG